MFQDEQNYNYRYSYKDPYQNEGNMLYYSNNNINQNHYSTNNYNNDNNNNYYNSINYNYNNNNSISISNDNFSQNSMTEKKEESINSIYPQTKTIDSLSKRYFSKVTVDNIRQPKDFIYMLDNFLTENNYPKDYKMNQEKSKISFIFHEESIAFNFTKYLNSIKNRNALYMEMNVHLSLTPNDKYSKDGKEIKKRGLSYDSIQRLFNGIGSKKQEKRKINSNLDPGISSPFSYPYERRRNKKMKEKNSNSNSFMKEKLKDYNKLPIRVLDTKYKGLRTFDFRDEAKDKWISPSTFKC